MTMTMTTTMMMNTRRNMKVLLSFFLYFIFFPFSFFPGFWGLKLTYQNLQKVVAASK